MMNLFRSKAAFEEARNYMPGGVNSPVRSYPHMDCPPPFIASAKGSHITTARCFRTTERGFFRYDYRY